MSFRTALDTLAQRLGYQRQDLIAVGGHARGHIVHTRYRDPVTMELLAKPIVLCDESVLNLITNVGRVWIHTQAYATSGIGANGLNYIAVSNDLTSGNETATSTTLSNEITTNGLGRVQGTVVLPTGSGTQTTVSTTFTATGSQSAKKAALFTAVSAGTMSHVLDFSATRSLITSDTLAVTFTITVS